MERLVETEEQFGEVYGPIFTDADGPLSQLWELYQEACNEDDERTRWGEPEEEIDPDEWPSIVEWSEAVQRAMARLDDDAMLAHLERVIANFVAQVDDAVGLLRMIAERQPAMAPHVEDAGQKMAAGIQEVLGHWGTDG